MAPHTKDPQPKGPPYPERPWQAPEDLREVGSGRDPLPDRPLPGPQLCILEEVEGQNIRTSKRKAYRYPKSEANWVGLKEYFSTRGLLERMLGLELRTTG